MMRRSFTPFILASLLLPSCGNEESESPPPPPVSGPAAWPQWAGNPQHTGALDVVGQSPDRLLFELTLDPFVSQEIAGAQGNLLVHYPVPLVSGEDVFVFSKTGTFTGASTWESQEWNWKRLRWEGDRLVEQWTFKTDWKPEPSGGALRWEPVHQAVLAGGSLYVPGFGGTVHKLDAARGTVDARINPFGSAVDSSIFVAGPLSADAAGNVFYNALQLDLSNPWGSDARDAWLVRVGADGASRTVRFAALTPGAPATDQTCLGAFSTEPLPWPPSASAVPPSTRCGSQRPGLNVAPAISQGGTIYTVSRAHFNPRYGYLVAVNPDLSPRWAASLGERLHDGCGVPASEGGVLPPNGAPGGCRVGSLLGVDPQTNRPGSGRVIDESSASPVVTPDGSVLFGTHTRYNYSRGHLMKFSSSGAFLGAYEFGWDLTPAIDARSGGYSIIVKDNHYPGTGSYCADEQVCGRDPLANAHAVSRLRGDTLAVEWSVRSPEGTEWCINAPAVDRNGTTYGLNEDGAVYAIGADGAIRKRLPLKQPLGAAYTPLSLDASGRLYAQNAGHLFVLGR
jgi:hypothetical protein